MNLDRIADIYMYTQRKINGIGKMQRDPEGRIQRILRLLLLATVEFNLRNVQVLSRTGVVDGRKEGPVFFIRLSSLVTTT